MNYKYTVFSLSTVSKSSGGEMIFSSEIQKPEQNEPVQRTNMYTATVSAQPHFSTWFAAF